MDPNVIDYVVWEVEVPANVCRLGRLENVERAGELNFNLPRLDGFPEDACLRMDPDFPLNTLLADRLDNLSSLIVASAALVDLLKAQQEEHLEYLAVRVLDHRDRPVEDPYFIINPLDPVPCLDLERCGPVWNRLFPEKVRSVERLELAQDQVDPSRQLFTCDPFHKPKLVHRSLAARMNELGLTGNRFCELADFRS